MVPLDFSRCSVQAVIDSVLSSRDFQGHQLCFQLLKVDCQWNSRFQQLESPIEVLIVALSWFFFLNWFFDLPNFLVYFPVHWTLLIIDIHLLVKLKSCILEGFLHQAKAFLDIHLRMINGWSTGETMMSYNLPFFNANHWSCWAAKYL